MGKKNNRLHHRGEEQVFLKGSFIWRDPIPLHSREWCRRCVSEQEVKGSTCAVLKQNRQIGPVQNVALKNEQEDRDYHDEQGLAIFAVIHLYTWLYISLVLKILMIKRARVQSCENDECEFYSWML